MAGLVNFDQKGALGPAMTLIYNSEYYNLKGVTELASLLKENFTKLAGFKPKGKKAFSAFVVEKNQSQTPISPIEIIGTEFFQNMQKPEPFSANHEKVLGFIVPGIFKTVQEQIPQAKPESQINEWTARFIETYLTEEQIANHCKLENTVSEKIMETRKNLGMEIYKACKSQQLTEKDLDRLLDVSQIALEKLQSADHFAPTLSFTGKYLTLFSMNEENPMEVAMDTLKLLSTVFREKMFQKE